MDAAPVLGDLAARADPHTLAGGDVIEELDEPGDPAGAYDFGLGAGFTSASVAILDLSSFASSLGGTGFADGVNNWVTASYQPTSGQPPRVSYYVKLDPANFDAAGRQKQSLRELNGVG